MQLYALNQENRLISAGQAKKGQDYNCLECQMRIRLRSGLHRQPHFYHLKPNLHCRLHGKGMTHLQIQQKIYSLLPLGESQLEYRFPEIKRIADVAWLPQRIVFEIQCASISAEEVQMRNRDYRLVGWKVVWILHDKRYNKRQVSGAERALRLSPHYFTNLNQEGKGLIYDQFDVVEKGLRLHKMGLFPVMVNAFTSVNPSKMSPLDFISNRLKAWPVSFKGDLLDLDSKKCQDVDWETMKEVEKHLKGIQVTTLSWQGLFKEMLNRFLVHPYRLLFQVILERTCR